MELWLAVSFSITKVKYISMYLELHCVPSNQHFTSQFLSIPPNIMTTNISSYTVLDVLSTPLYEVGKSCFHCKVYINSYKN